MEIRDQKEKDISSITSIFNEVVEEGGSIPFLNPFSEKEMKTFLSHETLCRVMVNEKDEVLGVSMLQPNILGRCSSIANATYLVRKDQRNQGIGYQLVNDSLQKAKKLGFRLMQFNGVVDSNIHARRLYKKCGFIEAGIIPKGFQVKDGHYEDMHIMYRFL